MTGHPYQAGGSLPANAPTYVRRDADTELLQALQAGTYCYVLNSRQMGKSSLRIRTMDTLEAAGVACAEIELSGIGSQQISAQQWYGGMIQELASGFDLRFNRRQWLAERGDLTPVQRWSQFIETVLLAQIAGPVVIFIDEIDSVLGLEFSSGEFFAAIRTCYDRRATRPEFARLTFALLGVATPSELIRDRYATPFNIGRAVELRGFRRDDCGPLVRGLAHCAENPDVAIAAVLDWTAGQPFLTQKLCRLLAENECGIAAGREGEVVAAVVRDRILTHWETQDDPEHLRTIRDRLLWRDGRGRYLELYREVLRRDGIPDRNTTECMMLRLTGVVRSEGGQLVVKNRIYRRIFDRSWVREQLGVRRARQADLPRWALPVASVAATALVMGARWLGALQGAELLAFDHLAGRMPLQPPDDRLLLVVADETDISDAYYDYPLSDADLSRLIDRLGQYQVRAIGLDIARDEPEPAGNPEGYRAFSRHVAGNENLYAVCTYGGGPSGSIEPPPRARPGGVGFADLYTDANLRDYHRAFWVGPVQMREGATLGGYGANFMLRRYLLSRSDTAEAACATEYSFGLTVAAHYLREEGRAIQLAGPDRRDWQVGETVLPRLRSRSGGYQVLDASGNQLLLRYRSLSDPQNVARQVTLRDVLEGNLDPAAVEDRIVLIGQALPSNADQHVTPIGRIHGIHVHAHAISQLLSAAEGDRGATIWWWPQWGDALWVLGWAAASGALALCWRDTRWQVAGAIGLAGGQYAICWLVLTQGGWLPLVPGTLAGIGAASAIASYQARLRSRQHLS